jgi:hypothetical protein
LSSKGPLPLAPSIASGPQCSPLRIASASARVAPVPWARRRSPPTTRASRPWRNGPCRTRGISLLWSGAWFHACQWAPRRKPTAPEPHSPQLAVPQPVPAPSDDDPTPAPGTSTARPDLLELELAELRRVVASLEAGRAAQSLRPRSPEPLARPAACTPADPAEQFLADGTSVAQAMATRDARIAQLLFELADRNARQLDDRLSRASAFVHNPSNQLAAPTPPELAAEPVSPRAREPSPPSRRSLQSPPPPHPARPPPLFSSGLGLARGATPQSSLVLSDRTVLAEPPAPARASTQPPWA